MEDAPTRQPGASDLRHCGALSRNLTSKSFIFNRRTLFEGGALPRQAMPSFWFNLLPSGHWAAVNQRELAKIFGIYTVMPCGAC